MRSIQLTARVVFVCSVTYAAGCTDLNTDNPPVALQTGGVAIGGGMVSSGGTQLATGGVSTGGELVETGGVSPGTGGLDSGGTVFGPTGGTKTGSVASTGGFATAGTTMTGGLSVTGGTLETGGVPDSGGTPETGGMEWGTGESGFNVGATAAHNTVRARVPSDTPLPPLTWDEDLAAYAQEWADLLASTTCYQRHRDAVAGGPGENIYQSWSNRPPETPIEDVVEGWAQEIDCWTYGTISGTEQCVRACVDALNASGCGHYTQLVWRNSQHVGCGRATCDQSEIWVCNYDPAGNFITQFPY